MAESASDTGHHRAFLAAVLAQTHNALDVRDQSLSASDQMQSETDQTAADRDQSAADGDQLSADSDQAAADMDQAASDRFLVRSGDIAVHEQTRNLRDQTARQRQHVAWERVGAAARRDATGEVRDLAGEERDQVAKMRDCVPAAREESVVVDERRAQCALIVADDRRRAASNRATAADARFEATKRRTIDDRDRATRDRRGRLRGLFRELARMRTRTPGPAEPQMVGAPVVGAPTVGSGASILVVDDSHAKRVALRAMLAPLGHTIVDADSGRAAVRTLESETFAIILMDVRMPTLNGFETAKLCRQQSRGARTPIIFVTAYGEDKKEEASAYASGGVDFIAMPVLPNVLQAKVTAFVDPFVRTQKLERSLESITARLPSLAAAG